MVRLGMASNFRIIAATKNGTILGGTTVSSSLSNSKFTRVSFTFTSPGNGDIYIFIGGSDATYGTQTNGSIYLYGLVIYTDTTVSTNLLGSLALTSTVQASDYLLSDGSSLSTALTSKQNTITDGSLTIARTSGLQAALDSKQALITDGSSTIARTSGLQTALDSKASTTYVDTKVANLVSSAPTT